jgi:periplasmic protein TonB
MDINKILSADFLDIIFEGRNKDYGAYDLRRTYNNRIRTALIAMVGVCFVFGLSSFLASRKSTAKVEMVAPEIELDKFKEEKKVEPPPPPPPPKVEPPKIEVAKFTPPKIVKDEEVKKEDEVKEIKEIEDKKTGNFDQEGKKEDVVQPVVEKSTGVVEAPKVEEDYNQVFADVQIQSEFPGGDAAWRKYLERNLSPDVVKDAGAPAGRYTIDVNFTVDKDGNISDITANTQGGGEDYGAKGEAIKVIKKGPKWKPGIQNGRQVASRKKQSVVFLITDE